MQKHYYRADQTAVRLDINPGDVLTALDTIRGVGFSHPDIDEYHPSLDRIDKRLEQLGLSRREVEVWLTDEQEAALAVELGVEVAELRGEGVGA